MSNKICFLLPQLETTIIGEKIALKLDAFTKIGFCSLKLQFLPPETKFFPLEH